MIKHVVKNIPPILRFRFWPYTQKSKRGIGGKCFTTCFTVSWASLTSSNGLLKFLEYTGLFHRLVRISFYFQKWSHYSYLSFYKEQNDGNFFTTCFIKGTKGLKYTCLLYSLVRICFYLEKVPIPIYYFKTK